MTLSVCDLCERGWDLLIKKWYWYNCVNYDHACFHAEFTSWPSQAGVLICSKWKLLSPPLESFTCLKPCWPSLSFLPFLLFGEKDGAKAEGRAGSQCQAGVLLLKSLADSKVVLRLGAGRQKSKCHPLAVERAKDLSPASGRRQGTVARFLILAGRLAGILPRQTSVVSARADLLPWVLFQIARLSASPTFGRWCAGRKERGNPYPFSQKACETSEPASRQ